jgi:outer membrane protein OmpA-like peptidoglycan-associated protein
MRGAVAGLLALLLTCPVSGQTGQDIKGSQDHWLFTRMPNMYIGEYSQHEFDAYQFGRAPGTPRIEGRITTIRYWSTGGGTPPTALQICRNHTAAITRIGGTVVQDAGNFVTVRLDKDGKNTWAEVACDEGRYTLIIAEAAALAQVITAGEMQTALDKQGFVALDVHFDTGKATIKPESQTIIDQIVALMKGNPGLRIAVEGHTDNVGTAAANKSLSDGRAKSVLNALVKQGVDAGRLAAAGFGQERPVADNRTDEGRARNRRVELVKK